MVFYKKPAESAGFLFAVKRKSIMNIVTTWIINYKHYANEI